MKSKIISSSLLIVGFLIGATALSTFAAWTAPSVPNAGETAPCDPPKCNTAAPLNVASGLQTKLGQLSLNSSGAGAYGLEVVNAIKLIDAEMLLPAPNTKNPNNMVLTANADGVGTWKALSAVGGSDIVFIPAVTLTNTSGSWSTYNGGAIPAGTKAVILQATFSQNSGSAPTNAAASATIRKDASSEALTLMNTSSYLYGTIAATTNYVASAANQGIFPVSSTGSFQYNNTSNMTLKIIGYITSGGGAASTPAGLVVGGYNDYESSVSNWWGVATSGGCPAAYTARFTGYQGSSAFVQCLTK